MSSEICVNISKEDLAAIRSALNEVLELLDEWEFEIRMGRTRDEIESLALRLKRLTQD